MAEVVGVAASIGALIGVTTKTINYLSRVNNAPNERKALSRETTDLLQVLVSMKNQADEAKQSEPWSESIRLLATDHGALDQLQEALEKLSQKLKPGKGIKKVARRIVWTLDKDECNDTLQKIERVKSRISLALQGDHYKLTQTIKAETTGIPAINQRITELHVKEDGWLSPINFFKTQQDIFGRREEGTGTWLIDSPEFQDWVVGSSHTLCCFGIPGAGKSVLASVVVDDLRKRSAPTHSVGIAAAYCNFKERDMQNPENLLAGLCVQLIDRLESVPEALVQLHKVHKEKQTRPNLKEILKVLEEVAKTFQTTYLIVDALDECSAEVRDILLRELKAPQPTIRLLVTTRPIDSITGQFLENETIEIRANHGDLKKYIQSSCGRSSGLSTLLQGKDMLAREISDRVIDNANGMFLAAKFHMDSLSTQTNVKALKKAISSLPKEIDELYKEVFHRIDSQGENYRDLAVKALRWVAYAYRPLNVRELKEALAIEPGDRDFDSDAMPEIALVMEACAGLLIVEKETEQVRLVHYTAQSYLDALLASRYQGAHALIGSDCITYLSYDVFQHWQEPDDEPNDESDDESDDEGDDESEDEPEDEPDNESDDEGGDESDAECLVQGRSGKKQLTYYLLRYASQFWAKHCTAGQGVHLSA
ncbi:MAG: hypothetical protein Q9181_007891 [Wetmoreana brouardii]